MTANAPAFAPALTDTPLPAVRPPAYFEKPGPANLILASFLFLTLPVAAMVLLLPDSDTLPRLYFWLFGGTHIVVTLTIYGSRANRAHFTGSKKTVAVFVVIPLLMLAAFVAFFGLKMAGSVPLLAVWFWAFVRFMNFFHLTRQTFGVLQLFKARAKGKFPAWGRQCENATGYALVAALMVTHASGGICPLFLGMYEPLYPTSLSAEWLIPLWLLSVGAAVGLFAASVASLVKGKPVNGSWEAVLYFAAQFVGTFAAAFFLPLYLASLAIHYVEYHVLMVPRIAAQPLDPACRIDRGYGWLRARPVLLIGVILLLSALVTKGMGSMDFLPPANPNLLAWGVVLSLFDALILVHYFLEMFIWKFSDPHFRKSMSGVYFTPKAGT